MNLNGRTINPGELNIRVTIKSRTISTKTGGFEAPEWTTLATVWARWTNVHGTEVWAAQMAQASEPATVLIRYRAGIDNTCAMLKGADLYEIVSIDNIQERDEYLELKVQRFKPG